MARSLFTSGAGVTAVVVFVLWSSPLRSPHSLNQVDAWLVRGSMICQALFALPSVSRIQQELAVMSPREFPSRSGYAVQWP